MMTRKVLILCMAAFLFCIRTASAQPSVDTYVNENVAEKSAEVTFSPKLVSDMLVRISEIEVYPDYLNEYLKFALTVGAVSVREEPGVIAIYPMIQQRDSCQIRILEIYASQEAYRHHITTKHFQTYKKGTLHMVKRLDLVDMIPMNASAMSEIFRKLTLKINE